MPTFTDNCLDPGFGYENFDGYVRIWNLPRPEGGKLVMRHRWFWELFNGPIPDDKEVDHLCKNRRCCNPNHLRLLERTEHATITNKERYSELRHKGLEMLDAGYSKDEVAIACGRSRGAINLWLRWRNNDQ